MIQESSENYLQKLVDKFNHDKMSRQRLRDWKQIICWDIEGKTYYWKMEEGQIKPIEAQEPGFTLRCTKDVLGKIAEQKKPFFLALWGTGEIQFEGTFSDAFRLGYLFLNDKRKQRVVFLAHCFLNMNTRFPEGADFEGVNIPLIEILLKYGLGIVQMPCPEAQCLGLEKTGWASKPTADIRACFHNVAVGVADQIQEYLGFGYQIVAIIGMNPSPSCGVEVTKGKGTMLGLNRDTSEIEGSGVFFEELKSLIKERGLPPLPIWGVRRTLPGERGLEEKMKEAEERILMNLATG
jgi:predicted secreted protein